MFGLALADLTGLDGSQARGRVPPLLAVTDFWTYNWPVTSPDSGSLDPQVLEAQRLAAPDQAVKDQQAALAATNAQIQQLNVELQEARADGELATVEKLRAQMDALYSQAQLDQIELQKMMSKQQAAIDAVPNTAAKSSALQNKIIGNIR